jgi:predicted unusual protein kinase regulating ubiquinone biosynthesis (AarF/ABC1/UbiB family)
MQSAVEADLQQLQWLLAIRRRLDTAIDITEIAKEIGARVREELEDGDAEAHRPIRVIRQRHAEPGFAKREGGR